ncbi:MAG: nickel-dependent hydrogenase large subunit [Nitrospirota bacterium]
MAKLSNPPIATTKRVVVDPVTRIEGHLRIEVEVTNGKVSNAWSTGTLFRGIETILKGRNPEDAWLFTQRVCGVCTYVHGAASVRSVEDALSLTVPDNARIVRNLLMGTQYLHDHIVHFYHLHALDWVDIEKALQANPGEAEALAAYLFPGARPIDFAAVQERLKTLVGSGQLGPFAAGYWGHPEYLLGPEENLILLAHYLEALRQQARTARMHAIFGGKNPHVQSLLVGGVTCRDDLNQTRVSEFRALWQETKDFIDTIYVPGVSFLAQKYSRSGWGALGATSNFLAFGEFPESEQEPESLFFPRGAIFRRGAVAGVDTSAILEHVKRSWYAGDTALHPSVGETVPSYTSLNTAERYSWLKAPRYQTEPMEVGPLARMLVAHGSGQAEARRAVDDFFGTTGLPTNALYSTLGRTAARALETQIIADAMGQWLDQLQFGGSTFQGWRMPAAAEGMGLNEAPRGALGHWIEIQNQQIANYQMVVPSTWNFGPRCASGKPGPVEQALIGTPVADPERPLEILRTVHSFDPCIACAVHVIDTHRDKMYKVRVI